MKRRFFDFIEFCFAGTKGLLLLPILLSAAFLALKVLKEDWYLPLVQEDALLENLQFLFYLSAAFACSLSILPFKRGGQCGLAAVYGFLTLALFFVAFEEISWGQRIFGFETPLLFENNFQREASVHNLMPVQSHLEQVYAAAGFFGAFGYLLVPRKFKPHPWVQNLLPKPSLLFFFLPLFLFYLLTTYDFNETAWVLGRRGIHLIWRDQEPVELLFSAGIFLFFLGILRGRKKSAEGL